MRCSAFALLLLLCGTADAGDMLPLRIGDRAFQVEVAATEAQREHGLMGRTRLPADGGMLFVFERTGRHCFWMHRTSLPLSIAFIDDGGRIVGLADMQPDSDTLHCPDAAARYALEVLQGEFQRGNIAAGAQVDGLPQ